MRAMHTLAAVLLIGTATTAQTCTNTVRNMTMCPMLNNMPTNATTAELAHYDQQMNTLIPYIYTQMAMGMPITNTSLCTASVHAYACASSASDMVKNGVMFKSYFSQPLLKPCYQECKRLEACLPTNTLSICVDDGLLASNRACIGAGWPLTIATTPAATTPPPPTPPQTSAAHLRHLATRLPVILFIFIVYYMCE
jgi:hypothetical protein